MSVGLIAGSAGSGKSTTLYETVIGQAMAHPNKQYLVIVPEQFTLSTQQQLVHLHPRHVIMNIDVLSFDRLAYRIFDELGTDTLQVLEDTGKHLLLRKVAQEQEESLGVLKKNMKRSGYITQMKSLISELAQYDISPEELEEMLRHPSMSGAFVRKAEDILVMYRGFREKMQGQYITAEEILQRLMDVVETSRMIAGSTIVFDGFTGFTPIQYQLLRMLMPLTERMLFTVTVDESTSLFGEVEEQELFAMSKEMVRRLRHLAMETGVELEDVIFPRGSGRFVPGGKLEHLEHMLFRPEATPYTCTDTENTESREEELQLCCLRDPRQELEYVASEIERQVREDNARYRDFAVVCANMETYAYLAPGIFRAYHIPCFIDAKAEIVFHPFVEYLTSLFAMLEDHFSYESVMHHLRSGMTRLLTKEIDLLENYILAAGVRGIKKYQHIFTVLPRGYRPEELVELNRIREVFFGPVGTFATNLSRNKHTVKEISVALYRYLETDDIEQQLQERARQFREEENEIRAKEDEQIYGLVIDLLDKMVAILGEEEVTLSEYGEMLSSGLEALSIGVIPPGNDQVLIGDMERSRLNQIRVLYLLGANDGAIPKAQGHGGIISQMDREMMKAAGYEVAPTDRERAFMQRFYLYLIMTKPSRKLVVSYARVDNQGKALRCSYVIPMLQKLFPDLKEQIFEELPKQNRLLTPEAARGYYVEALRDYVRWGENCEELPALARWEKESREREEEQERGMDLLAAAFYTHRREQLSQAAVEAVFGTHMKGSVSRLEQYARCAYAYFLRYGLALAPRPEYSFEPVDMGNLYHQALEWYSRLLQEQEDVDWITVSEEQSDALLNEAVLRTYQEMEKTRILEDARDLYCLHAMEKTLRETVWALREQVKKGAFVPKNFEVDFVEVDEVDALTFQLDSMHDLRLYGKVDRVDLWETEDRVYVKIVDYKSGNKDLDPTQLYHGLQVQLVLYMKAVKEGLKKQCPEKEVEPGALFYYHIDRPLVLARKGTEEDRKDRILRELRMRGVVNAEDRVIEALHHDLEGISDVIPVGRKNDGTLRSDSRVLGKEEIEVMEEYSRMLIEETGQKILRGEFDCRPYQLGDSQGCDYCEFHGVCGFDSSLEGYERLRLRKQDSWEETIAKMKEEIEKKQFRERGGEICAGEAMDATTTAGDRFRE